MAYHQFKGTGVALVTPFQKNGSVDHPALEKLVHSVIKGGVDFRVAPDLYELSFDRVNVDNLSGIPLIGLKELSLKGWTAASLRRRVAEWRAMRSDQPVRRLIRWAPSRITSALRPKFDQISR